MPARSGFSGNDDFRELTVDGFGNVLFPGQGMSGNGSIFKADPSGIVTELASFEFPPNHFAENPYGRLTPDGAGGFYGLAGPVGGFSQSSFSATVFHLTAGNALELVANLPKDPGSDYSQPDGHLTLDASGIRPLPAGTEGRITYNGRTLNLRAGQGYTAAGAAPQPVSDFTMRFAPDQVRDPVAGDGLPAGSGFAILRRGKKDSAVIIGVLPDGTAFSKKSVISLPNTFPFFAPLYRDKSGSLNGQLVLADTLVGEIDNALGTTTHWQKSSRDRDKRFAGGFSTTMTAYGGKYKLPERGQPPLSVPPAGVLLATFDRGGLFTPLTTPFTFTGAKPIAGAIADDAARATLKFTTRTGLISGTFRPEAKPVKYRGIAVLRDNACAGYFLGTADAGSVAMEF